MKEEILAKLLSVQAALKAPKDNYNTFGRYNYRSCEDILEAVKPHLKEAGLTLMIRDEIVMMGDRIYVKAIVSINGEEAGSAFAREELTKKGMDASQITGTASSYARKYALNGVFLIDDTKDADTMDNSTPAASKPSTKPSHTPEPNRNQGVTDWRKWKTSKGTTLGDLIESKTISTEDKRKGLEVLKTNAVKQIDSASSDEVASDFHADLEFINQALSELPEVPF